MASIAGLVFLREVSPALWSSDYDVPARFGPGVREHPTMTNQSGEIGADSASTYTKTVELQQSSKKDTIDCQFVALWKDT